MKKLTYLFIAVLTICSQLICTAQNDSKKVEVYYFHFTRRCATCNAVESVSKEAVADLYGPEVCFADYNLEEPEGELKGKELQVSGQALLIVSGNTKIDITNEGFMNARSNPEKLKQVIKEKIDPLL
ncbi:nitrophenyl compound nitroreductase subunit ArsF family protein [Bacteroidota bacterium]